MPDTAPAPAAPAAPAPAASTPPASSAQPPSAPAAPPNGDTEATPPSRPPLVGADGRFVENWTQLLPDEFAHDRGILARYQTPEDLAIGAIHAQRLVGKKGTIVPTPQSPPEEVAAFRKAVGAPEDPKAYIPPADKLPKGLSIDEAEAKPFLEIAAKYHIPAAAMHEMIARFGDREISRATQSAEALKAEAQKQYEADMAELRKAWGGNFDQNVELTRRTIALGSGSFDSPAFSDPEVVKVIHNLSQFISEDRLIKPSGATALGSGNYFVLANDIMTNEANPEHQAYRNGDRAVQEKVSNYLRLAEKAGQLPAQRLGTR